jgi:PIN domain nuclease of toxin-antitoxin system
MRLLLDTHIALWAVTGHAKMPARATSLILAADEVFVSAASIWEISIKHSLKPDKLSMSGEQALNEFSAAGFSLLAISPMHAATLDNLAPHHRDPFDRMLIAQALSEPLRLITHDSNLQVYSELVQLI